MAWPVDHSPVRSRRSSRGRHASSLLIATICCVAAALGCSDHAPIAPLAARVSSAPLPPSARYIIELEAAGKAPPTVVARIASAGGRILRTHDGVGMMIVSGLSAQAATALQHVAGVRYVMPDVRLRFIHGETLRRFVPPRGWHPSAHGVVARGNPQDAPGLSQQWNMTQVQADSAWSHSTQGSGEKVFILDTGIDTAHVDLKGRIDIPLCTSFAYADTDTLMLNPLPFSHDVVGHGSFVSSIITTNSLGIAAVAPQAQVVMVRVLDDSGEGSSSALISGLLYAGDNGAKIINMSLGGYLDRTSGSYLAFADFYQRVVDYVVQRGAVLAAAAGNESVNTNTAMSTSGSYADSLNTPAGLHHVLSVGATGPVDQVNFDSIAVYSNYGDAGVGVFAPGGNTVDYGTQEGDSDLVIGVCSSATSLCPDSEDEYAIGAGTSFASPMAAGEAAVVQAQQGGAISGSALELCILVSATEVTGKRPDPNYNYGRINVYSAIKNSNCK
jgi:subtilisin family serine protease